MARATSGRTPATEKKRKGKQPAVNNNSIDVDELEDGDAVLRLTDDEQSSSNKRPISALIDDAEFEERRKALNRKFHSALTAVEEERVYQRQLAGKLALQVENLTEEFHEFKNEMRKYMLEMRKQIEELKPRSHVPILPYYHQHPPPPPPQR